MGVDSSRDPPQGVWLLCKLSAEKAECIAISAAFLFASRQKVEAGQLTV